MTVIKRVKKEKNGLLVYTYPTANSNESIRFKYPFLQHTSQQATIKSYKLYRASL